MRKSLYIVHFYFAKTLNKTIKMESIVVHTKNQTELNAVKGMLKEMGIKFEKFHTRNTKTEPKTFEKRETKPKK